LEADDRYRNLLLTPLRKCADYTPKFGQGGVGLTLDEFRSLYNADPLYSWVGFDSPLMYAAHKAAGGMTSVYRQLGIGCERLFRAILRDHFGLSELEATWNYTIPGATGTNRKLALDGRIDLDNLVHEDHRQRVGAWLSQLTANMDVQIDIRGAVFEVRQGYKSKDSKRQNADLANAASAFTQRYFPVLVVMSSQLDTDIKIRYQAAKWVVLAGIRESEDPFTSTFAFCKSVIGYDIESFFERNATILRTEVNKILRALLEPA
jgi:hypothetical protein